MLSEFRMSVRGTQAMRIRHTNVGFCHAFDLHCWFFSRVAVEPSNFFNWNGIQVPQRFKGLFNAIIWGTITMDIQCSILAIIYSKWVCSSFLASLLSN